MTLLLSNAEIEGLIDMKDCLAALENMYRDFGRDKAKELERAEAILPHCSDKTYAFASLGGIYPAEGVVALRIKSDMISWGERRTKLPLAPGERWVGLIFLFSTSHTNLLAIMPDGVIQKMRVGATTALGAKYLARRDAQIYGLIGSGWQAGGQIEAMAQVRALKKIKVFSPTPAHRKQFAQQWSARLGIDVVAVESAQEAVKGSDIVGCATNSLLPVLRGDWLAQGMHITCIRTSEIDSSVIQRADLCIVHRLHKDFAIHPQREMIASKESLSQPLEKVLRGKDNIQWSGMHELKDLICGAVPGRTDDSQITCFVNNLGIGLQFSAVGSLIYKKAREKGVGNQLPDFWFSQEVKD